MRYVRERPWPIVTALYAAGGAVCGLGLPAMKRWAALWLGRPGFAVAFAINIAMPLLVVGLTILYPRRRTAWLGTSAASAAFLLSAGLRPAIGMNWLGSLIAQMGPILLVGVLAYHVLALATVFVAGHWRKVGEPPDPRACRHCGYLLVGLSGPRCPECFHPVLGKPPSLNG